MAANKRLLKKEIHRICGALAGECVLAKIAIPGIDREKLNEIIYQLADLQASALRLVSVEFPRTPRSFDTGKSMPTRAVPISRPRSPSCASTSTHACRRYSRR